jgi:hypothetical protein
MLKDFKHGRYNFGNRINSIKTNLLGNIKKQFKKIIGLFE